VLVEVMGRNGPLEVLLNGQHWDAPVSENPLVGSTEDWELINLTMDAHPIHLHLVQFHLMSRQEFMADKYAADWYALNGMMPPYHHKPKALAVKPYLLNDPVNPPGNEKGWKDTIRANPGEVTTIRVRFAPQNAPLLTIPGLNYYPFDPTKCPGYAWHCHILDHEDNEMMRPYKVRGFFE
ncbi:MAG TPA: multicopper oxidase domain-containing protein, partial [Verrucomicrobiae bacterium]|nr:multicopper oxidase domain-containing protein [Verrucomicrobiae bacterium]